MLYLAKLCGLVKDEELNETKNEKTPLILCKQPTVWKEIKTPFYTTNNEISNKMLALEKILKINILKMNETNVAINKSLSIHHRLKYYKIIQKISRNYLEWGAPSTFGIKTVPLFIYFGSIPNGKIFASVLDQNGNCLEVYFEKYMSNENVSALWARILSLYDKNGCIQTVILFDSFYAASSEKNRLPDGGSLREIWDKDLETFYYSEITYEELGFSKDLYNKDFAVIRSSMPSFGCINQFDGKMRPNMFCQEKKDFVWYMNENELKLVRTKTGEVLKEIDVLNESEHKIAEFISENE